MCTIKVWHIAAACAAACLAPLSVGAQQAAGNAPQPPQLERLDEGDATVIIRKPEGQQGSVVEKRARGGRVTEVEVNSGKSTYYLRPNNQVGSAVPGDVESNTMRAPQWRIFGFDLKRPEDTRRAGQQDAATTPAPPSAPAPSGPPGQ